MKPTKLKPVQITDLITESINQAMTGNMGIAVVKISKHFAFEEMERVDFVRELIYIELEARKAMKVIIEKYLNK